MHWQNQTGGAPVCSGFLTADLLPQIEGEALRSIAVFMNRSG